MSTTLESKNYLDILHSQTEGADNSVNHIPIRKIKFEDLPKPTNLDPIRSEVSEIKIEDIIPEIKISKVLETNNSELDLSRTEYVRELVPYINLQKIKRTSYKKIMADLGTEKEMPETSKPKELVLAREEYLKIKNKERGDRGEDVNEVLNLRSEIISMYPNVERVISKALSSWDKLSNEKNINAKIALTYDLNFLSYTEPVKTPTYEGLRANKEISEEKIETPKIEEVLQQIPIMKMPEVAVVPETNVSSITFEGKEIKILRNIDIIPQEITVIFDEKEIAKGILTNKGPSIKVDPRYKAGFLLAPTREENAFAKALPVIKSFKL